MIRQGPKPVMVFPGLTLTSALMRPLAMHVTAVPAMMPFGAAAPKSTSDNGETTTVAKPEIEPLTALTALVYVPSRMPAVNRPELLLMVPAAAMLGTTDQTSPGVGTMRPVASKPVAVNCCVPLAPTAAGLGVIAMDTSAPDGFTLTRAEPTMLPLVAWTVSIPLPASVGAV